MNAIQVNQSHFRRRYSRSNDRALFDLNFLRKKANGNSLLVLSVSACLSLGFVCLVLARQTQHRLVGEPSISVPMKGQNNLIPGFPSAFIDIWPDSRHQSKLLQGSVLRNHCVQSNHYDSCIGVATSNGSEEIDVILIRSPGIFGRLLDDFFASFVRTLSDEGKTIHTIHTVFLNERKLRDQKERNRTVVMIRLAVLPPALEAMDLALALSNKDKETPIQIKKEDLIDAMRLWAAWHCGITSTAQKTNNGITETPLLTVPLDLMLAYPMKVERKFADFLGIALPPEEKRKHVAMERRIHRSLDRIDECYDLSISLPVLETIEVPDCPFVSSPIRLRNPIAPWVTRVRRMLLEGESQKSVCRPEHGQLSICER